MITKQDDIFRVGVCTECRQEDVLDTNRDICWNCWCAIDLVAHESEQVSFEPGNDGTEEEQTCIQLYTVYTQECHGETILESKAERQVDVETGGSVF